MTWPRSWGSPGPAGQRAPSRRRSPAAAVLLLTGVALASTGSTAGAAFEWEHDTPASLVAGDSPFRWPTAGRGLGLSADAVVARPWSWPGVGAAAARLGVRGQGWAAGVAVAQLGAAAYRESRITGGFERALSGPIERRQQIGLAVGVLAVAAGAGAPTRAGAELDLGWSAALGRLAVSARARSAFQSRGASALRTPRRLSLRLRATAQRLLAELELEEGDRGRRLGMGLILSPAAAFWIGAGWSSADPPLRLGVGVGRGALGLAAGWAWHPVLPPSRLVQISRATPLKGEQAAPWP